MFLLYYLHSEIFNCKLVRYRLQKTNITYNHNWIITQKHKTEHLHFNILYKISHFDVINNKYFMWIFRIREYFSKETSFLGRMLTHIWIQFLMYVGYYYVISTEHHETMTQIQLAVHTIITNLKYKKNNHSFQYGRKINPIRCHLLWFWMDFF